jgi:hypothetical protein
MRDDENQQQASKAETEPATPKSETAKKKRERQDTLTDDNPLICRGTD